MIYRVEKTLTAYVAADSEEEAKRVDIDEIGSDVEVYVTPVESLAEVPTHWQHAIPFGSNRGDDRAIRQLLR